MRGALARHLARAKRLGLGLEVGLGLGLGLAVAKCAALWLATVKLAPLCVIQRSATSGVSFSVGFECTDSLQWARMTRYRRSKLPP